MGVNVFFLPSNEHKNALSLQTKKMLAEDVGCMQTTTMLADDFGYLRRHQVFNLSRKHIKLINQILSFSYKDIQRNKDVRNDSQLDRDVIVTYTDTS